MSRLVRNDETGQYGIYHPDTGVRPISDEEAAVMQKGAGQNLLESTGGALWDNIAQGGQFMMRFMPQTAGLAGLGQTQQITDEAAAVNDPQQEARRAARPGLETTGQVAAVGVEIAGGGGAGSVARRFGSSVENVILGSRAATQATKQAADNAAEVIAREGVKDVPPSTLPEGAADDSINAQRNNPVRTAGESDFITAQQADDLGWDLSTGQRQALNAAEAQDADALARAQQKMGTEDYLRKQGVIGDVKLGDTPMFAADDVQRGFTREVLGELGEHTAETITDNTLVNIRNDAKGIFVDTLDNVDRPVQVKFSAGDELVDTLGQMRQAVDDLIEAPATMKNLLKKVEGAAEKGAKKGENLFDMPTLLDARKQIMGAADRAMGKGQHDLGSTYAQMKDIIDDAIEAALPPDEAKMLAMARHRWKLKKVLERTAATISKEDAGMINPSTFANNYRMMTPSYRNHTRKLNDFEKIMKTADYLTQPRANPGSTLVRGVVPAGKAAATGAAGLGVVAGGNALFN